MVNKAVGNCLMIYKQRKRGSGSVVFFRFVCAELWKMWRKIIVFMCLVAVCLCDSHLSHKKKPHHHHHYKPLYHLLYGGGILYYLTFLLIKIKVVFILGTIFTFLLFGGKLFAILKYSSLFKEQPVHHEPEKIYIESSPSQHIHEYGSIPYSASSNSYSTSYSPDFSPDQASFNGDFAGGQYYDSPPPGTHGRSYQEDSIYTNYQIFTRMIRKLNITDVVFNSMQLRSESCKKKFVCEADYNSRHSSLLTAGMDLFRDESYDKYRTNSTVASIEDCAELYKDCDGKIDT